MRLWGGSSPQAALQGHPDSKCSYCLCGGTAHPQVRGLSGLVAFTEEAADTGREECWDLGFLASWLKSATAVSNTVL